MNKKEFLRRHNSFLYAATIPFLITLLTYICIFLLPIYRISNGHEAGSYTIGAVFNDSKNSVLLILGLLLVFFGCLISFFLLGCQVNAELKRLGINAVNDALIHTVSKRTYILLSIVSIILITVGIVLTAIGPSEIAKEYNITTNEASIGLGVLIPLCLTLLCAFFSCAIRLYQAYLYKRINTLIIEN